MADTLRSTAPPPPRSPRRGVGSLLLLASILFISSALLASTPAMARKLGPRFLERHAPPRTLVRVQAQDIGAGAAADAAGRATGGRVLNVKRSARGGQVIYHVKVLLAGGKLRIVRVDGQSGQVR